VETIGSKSSYALTWCRPMPNNDDDDDDDTGQLILSKIIKIAATSCQTVRLKCTKFDFG